MGAAESVGLLNMLRDHTWKYRTTMAEIFLRSIYLVVQQSGFFKIHFRPIGPIGLNDLIATSPTHSG